VVVAWWEFCRRGRQVCAGKALPVFLARCTMHYLFCTRGAWFAAEPADRSSSSASIRAVFGVRPSASRAMWRIASSSRNSASMVSSLADRRPRLPPGAVLVQRSCYVCGRVARGRAVSFESARCALVEQFVDVTTRLWPRCGVPRAVEHMHNKPHMRVTATNGSGARRPGGRSPIYPWAPWPPWWATHRCRFGKQPFTSKA
jgi:hypothetical protein